MSDHLLNAGFVNHVEQSPNSTICDYLLRNTIVTAAAIARKKQ